MLIKWTSDNSLEVVHQTRHEEKNKNLGETVVLVESVSNVEKVESTEETTTLNSNTVELENETVNQGMCFYHTLSKVDLRNSKEKI